MRLISLSLTGLEDGSKGIPSSLANAFSTSSVLLSRFLFSLLTDLLELLDMVSFFCFFFYFLSFPAI